MRKGLVIKEGAPKISTRQASGQPLVYKGGSQFVLLVHKCWWIILRLLLNQVMDICQRKLSNFVKILKGRERRGQFQTYRRLVLRKLKKVDKVAWLRFASVYLEFEDLTDFEKAIEKESLKMETQLKGRKTASRAGRRERRLRSNHHLKFWMVA